MLLHRKASLPQNPSAHLRNRHGQRRGRRAALTCSLQISGCGQNPASSDLQQQRQRLFGTVHPPDERLYGWSGIPVVLPPNCFRGKGETAQLRRSRRRLRRLSCIFAETFDSVEKYRQVLAAQPDPAAQIVSVGPLSNLKRLLDSAPDRYSELPGWPTSSPAKVRLLTIMGRQLDASGAGNSTSA